MPIPLLGFLTSPIAKIGLGVVNKVVDGVKHKNELKQIQKAAQIEGLQQVDLAKIEAQKALSKAEAEVRKAQVSDLDKTWRDELLAVCFCSILLGCMLPWTQPHIERGFQILSQAPEFFTYGCLAIIGGTFGLNLTNKLKKK